MPPTLTRALSLALLAAAHIPASTAQGLAPVVQPVRSDSVVFLDRDITNYQLLPLLINQAIEPQRIIPSTKPLNEQTARWTQHTLPQINAVGGSGDENTPQGLAAAATLYEAASLWMLTGNAAYLDAAERALTGGLPAAMLTSPDITERSVAAQAMMDASQIVYATDTAGIYVNFYLNTFAHITEPPHFDILADLSTGMPWSPMVRLRLRGAHGSPQTFTLRLRLPEWSEARPPIYVNGHETPYTVERGYAAIRRSWQPHDELYMLLDVTPRAYTRGDSTLLRCGPVVYCAQGSVPPAQPLHIEADGEDPRTGHPRYALCTRRRPDSQRAPLLPYFETPAAQRTVWLRKPEWEDENK